MVNTGDREMTGGGRFYRRCFKSRSGVMEWRRGRDMDRGRGDVMVLVTAVEETFKDKQFMRLDHRRRRHGGI